MPQTGPCEKTGHAERRAMLKDWPCWRRTRHTSEAVRGSIGALLGLYKVKLRDVLLSFEFVCIFLRA